jgi:hypothetical protein
MLQVICSGQCVGLAGSAQPLLCLNRQTVQALRALEECPSLSLKAVVESGMLKQVLAGSKKGGLLSISINVYGPSADAPHAGAILARTSTCLQHPFHLGPRYQYFNPQMYHSGTEMENITHLVGLTDNDIRAKTLSDEIERVLQSLGLAELDHGATDFETSTPLLSEIISTPLLR